MLYRLYRRIRLKAQVSRIVPFTVQRAVEHRALLTYAAEEAGVPTPRLRALVRAGPEAVVLANEHHQGVTLAQRNSSLTDAEINEVWDTVLRLHAHRVTHRALTGDRILLLAEGQAGDGGSGVMLLEPGNGDVAASDLQLRLDISQLLAELALLVGPDRAADIAQERIGADELAAVVPLLQPVALHRSTRTILRRRKDVLPALRKRLVGPGGRPRRGSRPARAHPAADADLAGRHRRGRLPPGRPAGPGEARRPAAPRRLALDRGRPGAVGGQLLRSGLVAERIRARAAAPVPDPARSAGRVVRHPGHAGRRRRRRAEPALPARAPGWPPRTRRPASACRSSSRSRLHAILLIIFAALARTAHAHSLRPPGWVYIAVAAVVAVVLVALAFPGGRRLLRSRLAPALGQVIPRLLDIAQQPVKLAEGIGGALLVTASYILCLQTSVLALGGSVPFVSVAIVYLTGSAIGSAVPTPGGLGAVEAALSAGLTAAGMPGITAVSAVLLYRTVTFWLPVPLGWVALTYLQRREAL